MLHRASSASSAGVTLVVTSPQRLEMEAFQLPQDYGL